MGVSEQACLMTTHNSSVSASSWLNVSISYAGFMKWSLRISPSCNYPPWHKNYTVLDVDLVKVKLGMFRCTFSVQFMSIGTIGELYVLHCKVQEWTIFTIFWSLLLSHVPPSTHHFLSPLVGANSGNQRKPFTPSNWHFTWKIKFWLVSVSSLPSLEFTEV